jgi:starch phosphorylase
MQAKDALIEETIAALRHRAAPRPADPRLRPPHDGYKRPTCCSPTSSACADRIAPAFQLVLAGKAHPQDRDGKALIKLIHNHARQLSGSMPIAFLPAYDMTLAKVLVSGADVWLNTPVPPMEASGTSGMKAALNGVPNLSVLDGWWSEACEDGVTGWAIGEDGSARRARRKSLRQARKRRAAAVVERPRALDLDDEAVHLPLGSRFHSQRMMRRYASEAYLR